MGIGCIWSFENYKHPIPFLLLPYFSRVEYFIVLYPAFLLSDNQKVTLLTNLTESKLSHVKALAGF